MLRRSPSRFSSEDPKRRFRVLPWGVLTALLSFGVGPACSDGAASPGDGDGDGAGDGDVGDGDTGDGDVGDGDIGDGDIDLPVGTGGTTTGQGGSGSEVTIITELPAGFVAADTSGGWDVVGSVDEVDLEAPIDCANIMRGIARDMHTDHPDFENGDNGLYPGIVEAMLGEDGKPVLADPEDDDDLVESVESFAQWYNTTSNVNLAFVIDVWLEPEGDTFIFDSATFFPLDDMGYALEDGGTGQSEGFHFTTEFHTNFQYMGGEVFTFRGDDDVWVFINKQLAIDLGGVHGAEPGSVALDDIAEEYGLVLGGVYSLDLFQAERQTEESNFRIETTLDFTDCGVILPVDIPK